MNDVSWRRILEQADSKQPFGDDQEAPNPERAANPGQSRQENVDWTNLEAELTRATHPASKTQASKPRRPSPGQHATQLKMRMEQASNPATPPVLEPPAKAAKSSGARNLIAISLSLAVVGFAAQQLSERLPQTGSGADEGSTAQNPGAAAFASAGSSGNAEPRIRVNGNRLDLRPSLASEADWPSEDVAVTNSTTTTSLNSDEVSTILPQGPNGAFENGENETLVLNRGREILERGHISGARLIFEYLADRGSALGAFALAQTYDAKFISKNNLPADAADEALATKWYRQAAEITSAAADTQ